jgi:uroporphyrinogen decarboxylase
MTPRESFVAALERKPPTGRVPHFELVFYLTMEALGRVHPLQRHYGQWAQMTDRERDLHRRDVADLHVAVARRYEHSGLMFHPPGGWEEEDTRRSIEHLRAISGQDYFVSLHGDATYGIPGGEEMMDFVMSFADRPDEMKAQAQRRVDDALALASRIKDWGVLDGFCLCSDYCFNDNSFLSPAMFNDFVAPYLIELVAGYRALGFYVIKHTDGNILPILDALVAARPHALHSLDPQGKVDLADMKRRVGDQLCLIGNVNCSLLQTGTDEQVAADVSRALREGMPGGGYIFGTSNCIYTGMDLDRYEMMLDIWRREGNYPQ